MKLFLSEDLFCGNENKMGREDNKIVQNKFCPTICHKCFSCLVLDYFQSKPGQLGQNK